MSDLKHTSPHRNIRKNERGNVLFIILIGTILFGALSFVVSGMMQGDGASQIAEQNASLLAGEVLAHARQVRQATQTMRINGCDTSQINFEGARSALNYTNSSAPGDGSCSMFTPDGGDVAPLPLANETAGLALTDGGRHEYYFTGSAAIPGIGTSAADLVMIGLRLNSTLCAELNDAVDGMSTIPVSSATLTHFTGTYGSETFPAGMSNQPAGCYQTANGENFFYHILVAR